MLLGIGKLGRGFPCDPILWDSTNRLICGYDKSSLSMLSPLLVLLAPGFFSSQLSYFHSLGSLGSLLFLLSAPTSTLCLFLGVPPVTSLWQETSLFSPWSLPSLPSHGHLPLLLFLSLPHSYSPTGIKTSCVIHCVWHPGLMVKSPKNNC